MAELVSPCCGAEYTDYEHQGTTCCGAKRSEEGLCYKCRDHADLEEGHTCDSCKEFFEHPIEDYEYMEQMKESIAEDRADEARDMGE